MSVEEAVTRVIQKERILGQSPGGERTSTVTSAERNGTSNGTVQTGRRKMTTRMKVPQNLRT